jgi:hypothetical protein
MSKILKVLGAIFIVIILLVVSFVLMNIYYNSRNSKESKHFAGEAMYSIGSSWDKEEVLKRYNPTIRPKISIEALAENLAKLGKSGVLKGNVENVDGHLILIKSFEGNPESTAVYNGELRLEKGSYVMRLYVSRWDGSWVIDQIDVCDKTIPESLENCKLTGMQMTIQ